MLIGLFVLVHVAVVAYRRNVFVAPAKIHANEGAAPEIFIEGDEIRETFYKDRGGKYQGQQGVTLPKT